MKNLKEIIKEAIEEGPIIKQLSYRFIIFFIIARIALTLEKHLVNVITPLPKRINVGSFKPIIDLAPSEYTQKWNTYEEKLTNHIMPTMLFRYAFSNHNRPYLTDYSIIMAHCSNQNKKLMSNRIYSIPYFKEKIIFFHDKKINMHDSTNIFFVFEEESLKDFVHHYYKNHDVFYISGDAPFDKYEIITNKCIFICTQTCFDLIKDKIPENYIVYDSGKEISYHFGIKEEYDALIPAFDEVLTQFLKENSKS